MKDVKPIGYFAWVKTNKGAEATPVKFLAEYEQGLLNITRKLHDESLVPQSKKPLDAEHWNLSLDELAALFPLLSI